ncbi:MAG: hypothetical protein ACKOEM_15435, partial [Planctomycetia bacterium]
SSGLHAELRRIAIRRLMALELPDSVTDIEALIAGLKQSRRPDGRFAAVGGYGSFTIRAPSLAVGLVLAEVPPSARRYAEIIVSASEPDVDSSELLYMILMRGPMAESDVLVHFRPDEIGDTDGDGLPEFVDAWRKPILFRRWPVGLDSPVQPASGQPDPMVSAKGYPLVPLIYSAGTNRDYDLDKLEPPLPAPPDGGYQAVNYDPFFNYNPAASDAARVLSAVADDDITNHDLLR